jgi:hypothetical protein
MLIIPTVELQMPCFEFLSLTMAGTSEGSIHKMHLGDVVVVVVMAAATSDFQRWQ